MSKGVITLTTGLKDITNLQVSDVKVWDWAWGLQHQGRFSGSTPVMWSVLSHLGLTYELLMRDTKGNASIVDQIAILLHDASEGYCIDVPRPIKRLPEAAFFVEIEERIQRTIFARFGLDWDSIDWELVNRYDYQALHVEFSQFFPHFLASEKAPPRIYEMDPNSIKLKLAKPQQYVDLLRHLTINLAEVPGISIPDINGLFEMPPHLAPYLVDRDIHVPIQHNSQSSGGVDDSILHATL